MPALLPQIAPPPEFSVRPGSSSLFDVVAACCRGEKPNDHDLDWQQLAEVAQEHGVVTRALHHLSGRVGAQCLLPLRLSYENNVRKSLLLTRELLRILDELQAHGIEVLPYKGPCLSVLLYGDAAARQYSDLDLMVRPRDVTRAETALLGLGYSGACHFTARQRLAYLKSGYELTFDSGLGRNVVELKWAIVPRFYAIDVDVDQFFARATAIQIAGREVKTLCSVDALLVLCIHAAKHHWSELSSLCDLDQMQRMFRFDWRCVAEQAEPLGVRRIVQITFALANRFLGTPLPEALMKDFEAQRLAGELSKLLTSRVEHDPETISYFRMTVRARERWRDRLRLITRLALNSGPGEWKLVNLPDGLFSLYSLIRVARLCEKAARLEA